MAKNAELRNVQTQLATFGEDLDRIQSELSTATKSLSTTTEEEGEVRRKLEQVEAHLVTAQQSLDTTTQLLKEAEARHSAETLRHQRDEEDARVRLDNVKADINKADAQLASQLTDAQRDVASTLRNKQSEIDRADEELREKRQELKTLGQRVADAGKSLEQVREELVTANVHRERDEQDAKRSIAQLEEGVRDMGNRRKVRFPVLHEFQLMTNSNHRSRRPQFSRRKTSY
jgi:chromosome segregation ATPase